jgi:hypothetical protein
MHDAHPSRRKKRKIKDKKRKIKEKKKRENRVVNSV